MLPENPDMLASYLNMQLRDNYSSLDELCDSLDISKSELLEKLKKADYKYNEELNTFK